MNITQLMRVRAKYIQDHVKYSRVPWNKFNYKILNNILYFKKRGRGSNQKINEVWIMGDTETSKKPNSEHNHVCAFTISVRAFNQNIVTMYGNKPSDFVTCMSKIHESMNGEETIIYFHNLGYDYIFLRKFMFASWGEPVKQLALKSHAPIYIKFGNGIILKDSLILAQRSLEKWAKDLEVTQKAVGKWDYNKMRNQDYIFNSDELDYIECDTLAGVECLNKLADQLHKTVSTMPFTATGIPREDIRKIGKEHRAKDLFNNQVLTYEQYIKATMIFHGGYTHANRFIVGQIIPGGESFDFSSSYPYVMLSEKFPMYKFMPLDDKPIDYILKYRDNYAFMFKLIMIKPELKDGIVMPSLQSSKCMEKINPIIDNGRIISAEYIVIYTNEIDVSVIMAHYNYAAVYCHEIEYSKKEYLPRWFTDYIFSLYYDKCTLKNSDSVLYRLQKAKLNSCYGMCVMRNIREDIQEDYKTGEYFVEEHDPEQEYNKYIKNMNNILPYQWGVWVTSYAFRNLHVLFSAVDPDDTILYADTDSIYATKFNMKHIEMYNRIAKQKIKDNGYSSVVCDNKEYNLGVAEHDSSFTEFTALHAKCYCKRESDGLHITVAGVPKKGAKCLHDDITNFRPLFVFDGKTTGKLQHKYIYVDDIYLDPDGNETGDSINLTECDYLLDFEASHDLDIFDENFNISVNDQIQIYEE